VRSALLSVFWIGRIPGPAGTYASLATAVALYVLHGAAVGPASIGVLVAIAFGVVATLALAGGVVGADGHGDPRWVVSDEVAGQGLAIAIGGAVSRGDGAIAVALAFALFRLFDVAKPGPVGAAERLPGGLGVLADDLVAGAIAGGLVAAARAAGALG